MGFCVENEDLNVISAKNMGPFMQVKQSIKVTFKVYLGLNCKNASHHDSHENF
jgi:hypothetical protein